MLRRRPAEDRRPAKAAPARHFAGQDHAGKTVFVAALLVIVVILVRIAGELAGNSETGETPPTAAADQSTGENKTRQAVFIAALLLLIVVVVFDALVVIAASEFPGKRHGRQAAPTAAADQSTGERETRQAVLVAAFLVLIVFVDAFVVIAASEPACKRDGGQAAPTAAADQSTGENKTRQAVLVAAFLVVLVILDALVVIPAGEPAGECNGSQTTAAATANQTACEDETRQAVLVAALFTFVIVFNALVVVVAAEIPRECETGQAAPAPPACESACQGELCQAVFVAFILVVFFCGLAFEDLVGEGQAGKLAATAHARRQEDLG